VRLLERPLAPGTVECQAIYPTFHLLTLARADLGKPLPTRVLVILARA